MQQSGFLLEHCRLNCPKSAGDWQNLYQLLDKRLINLNLREKLEQRFSPLHFHQLPKVCLAGCPNGCSQPNIKDFGISGYVKPRISDVPCQKCMACVHSCLEKAITVQSKGVIIDEKRCQSCGDCLRVCPAGTLVAGERGWTLRFGGRVGRHPRFAVTAGQVQSDEEAVAWVSRAILRFIRDGSPQERLSNFLERQPPKLEWNGNGPNVRESNGLSFQDREP